MNLFNKILLKLAMLPAPLYQRLGVNLFQLECIITTKLIMDDRRPNTFQQSWVKKKESSIKLATVGTMVMSTLFGAFYLVAFLFGTNILSQLTLYFLFFLFMLAASLITDFTSVLIDIRDNYIILPKPVNDRTVVVSRLLHIFIHICKLVIPMLLPGLIYLLYHYSIYGGLLFLFMGLQATILCIFFINALYIFILRITTPRRFQTVIGNFQIVFAVLLYASYQFIPRLLGQFQGMHIDFSAQPLVLLDPSYWFAAGWKILKQFSGVPTEWIGFTLSITAPICSIWIVVRYLAPAFNRQLSQINSTDTGDTLAKTTGSPLAHNRLSLRHHLSRWFTRSGSERSGFLFTWLMTARSKDFKMKVYPAIGYILVIIAMTFFNSKKASLADIREQTTSGKGLIIALLYFGSLLLLAAVNQLPYSDKYKAAWVYYASPLEKPGTVIAGGIKAIIARFFLPLALLTGIPLVALAGAPVLPNLLLGYCNQLLITTLIAYSSLRKLPFSDVQSAQQKTGSFLRTLFLLLIALLLAGLHYLAYRLLPVVGILAVLSATATWLLLGSIQQIDWTNLRYHGDNMQKSLP